MTASSPFGADFDCCVAAVAAAETAPYTANRPLATRRGRVTILENPMPARRSVRAIGPDSTHRVDLYVGPDLVAPALDVTELRTLQTAIADALARHPQADFVVGPDGRLWCPECAEPGNPADCIGAGCPGDNPAARSRRAYEAAEEAAVDGIVAAVEADLADYHPAVSDSAEHVS